MHIYYIGHNHTHDMDFKIHRPNGSGDYLVLLIKSPATFKLNGELIHTTSNTFFLYDKNTPQYYEAYLEPFSNDWFHFELTQDEMSFFKQLHIPFEQPLILTDFPFFSLLIKLMSHEFYGNSSYKLEVLNHYLQLFFIKISEAYQTTFTNQHALRSNQLNLLRSKIYTHPYNKWSIEGLAHEITLSPSYFQRLYKKTFGISCLNDIINARIEHAKFSLTQTDLSIKNIAQICGYENDVHFMRQFKNLTNLTPSQYRKRYASPPKC